MPFRALVESLLEEEELFPLLALLSLELLSLELEELLLLLELELEELELVEPVVARLAAAPKLPELAVLLELPLLLELLLELETGATDGDVVWLIQHPP